MTARVWSLGERLKYLSDEGHEVQLRTTSGYEYKGHVNLVDTHKRVAVIAHNRTETALNLDLVESVSAIAITFD